MDAPAFVVIFITAKDGGEAQRIARLLLEQKKAACVNIVPQVASSFWWQGRIDSAAESLLVVKTEARLLEDIIRLVKANHSYAIPEIIALPVIGGSQDYLDWIAGSLE